MPNIAKRIEEAETIREQHALLALSEIDRILHIPGIHLQDIVAQIREVIELWKDPPSPSFGAYRKKL